MLGQTKCDGDDSDITQHLLNACFVCASLPGVSADHCISQSPLWEGDSTTRVYRRVNWRRDVLVLLGITGARHKRGRLPPEPFTYTRTAGL